MVDIKEGTLDDFIHAYKSGRVPPIPEVISTAGLDREVLTSTISVIEREGNNLFVYVINGMPFDKPDYGELVNGLYHPNKQEISKLNKEGYVEGDGFSGISVPLKSEDFPGGKLEIYLNPSNFQRMPRNLNLKERHLTTALYGLPFIELMEQLKRRGTEKVYIEIPNPLEEGLTAGFCLVEGYNVLLLNFTQPYTRKPSEESLYYAFRE